MKRLRLKDLSVIAKFDENVQIAEGLLTQELPEEERKHQSRLVEELIDVGTANDKDVVKLTEIKKQLNGEQVVRVEESTSEVDLDVCEISEVIDCTITESPDGEMYAELRMIKPGWSHNGFYWTKEAVQSFVEHATRKGSRKMYIDHEMDESKRKYARSMNDWVAQITEARLDSNGHPLVKAHIFKNSPKALDLREKLKKFPEEVGTSVDAYAKVKVGEAEGRKGRIVMGVNKLHSLDFVTEASAGGGVVRVAAAAEKEKNDAISQYVAETILLFESAATDLKAHIKGQEERDKYWKLMEAFRCVLRNIFAMPKEGDGDEAPKPEDRAAMVKKALTDFTDELLKIDLTKVFESQQKEEEREDMFTSLREMKEKQPELYEGLVKEALLSLSSESNVKTLEAKVTELTTKVTTLETEIKNVTEAKEKVEKENAEYKRKADEASLFEARDKMIADAQIPAEYVSESFRTSVREARDEKVAEAMIKDRKDMVEKLSDKSKNTPAPNGGRKKVEVTKVNESADKADDKPFEATSVIESVLGKKE